MIKLRNSRALIALMVASLLIAIAFASVFVYYPLSLRAEPVPPPVYFQAGSNSNQPDLGSGNTIQFVIGDNATSAQVVVHPTYQKTVYKDIGRIYNSDNKAYYVYLRVNTPLNMPSGSEAKLCLDGLTACIDLTQTGTQYLGILGAGESLKIYLKFYIPEGIPLPSQSTASLELVYTTVQETPP